MNNLVICIALLGQAPGDPGVPWQNNAERLQWIENWKFQRAYAAAEARRARILADKTSGAAYSRHYPAFYGYGYRNYNRPYYQQNYYPSLNITLP